MSNVPNPTQTAERAQDTPYARLGGEVAVRALVDRFYDLMDLELQYAQLRAVHGSDLASARDKLFWFLSGWLGGPSLYIERFGHPRLRARHLPFDHIPRIALERRAVGTVHVADHAPHARRRLPPWKDLKRGEVRGQQHVGLLDPHEAFDARPVEHDVALQRLPELRRRNLDVLDDAQNIRELQAQKSHLVRLCQLEDVGGGGARQDGRNEGTALNRHDSSRKEEYTRAVL
jgi:truncated hemoglobin YjbI